MDLKSGGPVELYMKTYEEVEGQNLADRIPRYRREAQWSLGGILPTTQLGKRELLILNQDKNFCQNCFYVIGVISRE